MIEPIPEDDILWGTAQPENACVNYERCGNIIPNAGQMCGPCLDKSRKRRSLLDHVPAY